MILGGRESGGLEGCGKSRKAARGCPQRLKPRPFKTESKLEFSASG